jgi:hypothetical protein
MDLVSIAEAVAKSPYGLPLFLLVVVWYTAMMIKQKDMYLELHIKEDLEKSEERERWYRSCLEWYQNYLGSNSEHMANVTNDIKDIESILREGRVHFESDHPDDETSSDPPHNDRSLDHLRRKLSAGRKTR